MSIATVMVKANPILKWEQFAMEFDRSQIVKPVIEHRDIGGFYRFTFGIHTDFTNRTLTSDFLVNGGMRYVVVKNDKGLVDWEGFIGKVEERTGTVRSELDLNNVFNRQWCRYNDAGVIVRSTKFNDVASQTKIGITERAILGGEVSLGVANQYIESLMAWTSYPSPQTRQIDFAGKVKGGSMNPTPELKFVCYGAWHTLLKRTYNQTILNGDADASTIIAAIIADVGQFVVSTDIQNNITQLEQEADTDRYAGELITSILAVGDGGLNKWVAGFEEGLKFYYRQASRPVR